jgi:hypothetical protein
VIGNGEIKAAQPDDGRDQPFGPAQSQRKTVREVSVVMIASAEQCGCSPVSCEARPSKPQSPPPSPDDQASTPASAASSSYPTQLPPASS